LLPGAILPSIPGLLRNIQLAYAALRTGPTDIESASHEKSFRQGRVIRCTYEFSTCDLKEREVLRLKSNSFSAR
jgi:hypothetical protein